MNDLCGFPSSVSGRTCVLPVGHPADSPVRFHRFRSDRDRLAPERRLDESLDARLEDISVGIARIIEERDTALERLRAARRALVATGYFTYAGVGDDVAPRIIEMHSALLAARGTEDTPDA